MPSCPSVNQLSISLLTLCSATLSLSVWLIPTVQIYISKHNRDMAYSVDRPMLAQLLSCVCPAVSHRKISRDTWRCCHLASAKPRGEVSHSTKGKRETLELTWLLSTPDIVFINGGQKALTLPHTRKRNRMRICSVKYYIIMPCRSDMSVALLLIYLGMPNWPYWMDWLLSVIWLIRIKYSFFIRGIIKFSVYTISCIHSFIQSQRADNSVFSATAIRGLMLPYIKMISCWISNVGNREH